jgi:hypothetical protein
MWILHNQFLSKLKIVNNTPKKWKNQSDIGIDKLFDFFKDLNSDSEGNVYEGQLSQTIVYLKTVFPYGFYLNLNQGFSWQTWSKYYINPLLMNLLYLG